MSTKLIRKLTLASSTALLFLGLTFSSISAQGVGMEKYEVVPGVSMVLPSDDLTVEPGRKVDNKFLTDAEILATLSYKGMRAEVTGFKMDIVANPLDFLSVYAKAVGVGFKNGQVIRNKTGVVFGVGNLVLPNHPDQPFVVGLAFSGDRGYLVQAKTKSSAALAKTIVKDMKLPGEAWGALESLKPVAVGSKGIEINEAFNVTDIAEGPMKGVIITNGKGMKGSSITMVVKTNLQPDHDENRKVFETELTSANLEFKAIRKIPSETVFLARSKEDTTQQYMGFVTTNGTASISLIVPTAERDANAWLSGKYYYTKALRDLRK